VESADGPEGISSRKEDAMKLSDSYLCPDCNEVFEPDRTLMIHVKNPVCPGCGNRFNQRFIRGIEVEIQEVVG